MRNLKNVAFFAILSLMFLSFQNCARQGSVAGSIEQSPSHAAGIPPTALTLNATWVPSDGVDATAHLQGLISQAIAAGPGVQINLSAQTYRLVCTNQPNSFCLSLNGVSGLKLMGVPGLTKLLVASPRSGALSVVNSNQLFLYGFTLDYETPPFTQGVINGVSVNSAGEGVFSLSIDAGYPQPSDPQLRDILFSGTASGVIFDTAGNAVKSGDLSQYAAISTTPPIEEGPGNWLITTYNGNLPSFLSVGDRIALSARPTHGIEVIDSSDVELSYVNIYAAPAMALVFAGATGQVVIDHVNVQPQPGSNRLLSSNADAVHVIDSSAQLTVQNSYFANMGDDAINIASVGRPILGASGNYIVLAPTSGLAYKLGDVIQISSPIYNGSVASARFTDGEPVVTGIVANGSNTNYYLSKALPATVAAGDMAFNVSQSAPGSIIESNTFGSFRGSLRIRSVGAQVFANYFSDSREARILFSVDSPWIEGPMTNPPAYAANVVGGGQALQFFGLNFLYLFSESQ